MDQHIELYKTNSVRIMSLGRRITKLFQGLELWQSVTLSLTLDTYGDVQLCYFPRQKNKIVVVREGDPVALFEGMEPNTHAELRAEIAPHLSDLLDAAVKRRNRVALELEQGVDHMELLLVEHGRPTERKAVEGHTAAVNAPPED